MNQAAGNHDLDAARGCVLGVLIGSALLVALAGIGFLIWLAVR